jgi:hypothetical protein
MKRQITLSIVLALGVILSLARFAPTTQGQPPQQPKIPVADTGIVTLSPNQMLRLTVAGDWDGDGDLSSAEIFFRRLEYTQVGSSDGASKTALASQTTSDFITLAPGENASFDLPNAAFGVRGVVLSNRPDVRVTAQIINRTTGEVQAFSGFDGTSNTFLNKAAQADQPEVMVVRRISRARLTPAMIQTLRSIPAFSAAVAIQGNTIIALEGSSLWLLSNGGYALVVGGTVEPLASETWTKDMGNGDLYVASCFCPGATANPNDGCEFDGLATRQNCKGPNCCSFKDGVILGNGTPILF